MATILRIPILIGAFLVSAFVAFYFNIPLAIFPFATALYLVCLHPENKFARPANVIGGHVIGFIGAIATPFIIEYFQTRIAIPELLITAISVTISVLIVSLIMIVTTLEHPPAAGTALIFITLERQGELFLNLVPLNAIIGFGVGLGILALISIIFKRKPLFHPEDPLARKF